MHLLIFISSLSSGGAERVTTNIANYWAEKGWNITIVTLAGVELDFYKLNPSIHRISLCIVADSTNLLAAIKHNYLRIQALRSVLTQQQPDVALSFMTSANVLLALATRGLNIPAIGAERIHPPMAPLGMLWEWLRRRSYRYLDAVTALTTETAQWLKTNTAIQYVPVIPNAIIYPIVSYLSNVKFNLLSEHSFNLIAVGRLVSVSP